MKQKRKDENEMNENLIVRTAHFALHLLSQYVGQGDTVIDGTAGNGHDTLALARLTGTQGEKGKVYSFDIQQKAIERTAALLERHGISYKIAGVSNGTHMLLDDTHMTGGGVILIRDSHERIAGYVKEKIAGAVFNLGYMPGEDKTVTTSYASTIRAVCQTVELTKENGVVVVVIYAGHQGGAEEKAALLQYAKTMDTSIFHVAYIEMINQPTGAPSLLIITRKRIQKHTFGKNKGLLNSY